MNLGSDRPKQETSEYSVSNMKKLSFIFFYFIFTSASSIGEILSEEDEQNVYFYDLRLKDMMRRPVFERIPCQCQHWTCGCCAGMKLQTFNFDQTACMNFTYDPIDFAIEANMLMNDESIFEQKISARNPPPACLPVPIPLLASAMDFCVRFYDIYTPGRNVHVCVDFLARLTRAPVVVLHFNCLQIGNDGIYYLRPEERPITSTLFPPISNISVTEVTTEEFDPVTEIHNRKNFTEKPSDIKN